MPCRIEDIIKEFFVENMSAINAVAIISMYPPPSSVRYDVGTRVECKIHGLWHSGTITQLFYREGNWPRGVYAPYQIELDNMTLIFSPEDSNEVIRLRDHTADLFETLMTKVSDLEIKFW